MKEMSESVLIRPFHNGDEKGIWDILQEGTYSNINASFVICIQKTLTQVAVISLLIVGYAWGLPLIILVMFAGIALGVIYLLVVIASLFYLYGSTLSDIKDIHKSYFMCPDHHFWVAEYKGQIAGTIAVIQKISHLEGSPDIHDQSEGEMEKRNKVAWLRRMAVGKRFRRLGIAKLLVNECISFCRNQSYDSIFLITTEVHHAARSLYSKLGFNLLGCKPYRYVKDLVTVWTYEYEMILR